MAATIRLPVASRADTERARREARAAAAQAGLGTEGAEAVALATMELATNLLRYAREGEITVSAVERTGATGVEVVSRDRGPGIADVDQALQDGHSTGGGLGGGLGGVRRLMDEFQVSSSLDGTTIVARKWATP